MSRKIAKNLCRNQGTKAVKYYFMHIGKLESIISGPVFQNLFIMKI